METNKSQGKRFLTPLLAQPVAVRYAWQDDATPNLANKDGLPASLFRTDTWKGVTQP